MACPAGAEPDTYLVTRIRDGDQAAFGLLVERYQEFLRQVVLTRVHRPEVAEELVQEVFCTAYRKMSTLIEDELVSHWLARMAANLAVQWRRQQQAWKRAESRSWMVPAGRSPLGPDEELEAREARTQVQGAMAQLSPTDWQVVVLYYLEGWSCREISQILGVARDTIKGRLWRARRQLREELDCYAQELALAN